MATKTRRKSKAAALETGSRKTARPPGPKAASRMARAKKPGSARPAKTAKSAKSAKSAAPRKAAAPPRAKSA